MIAQRGRVVCGDGIFFHQAQDDGQGIIIDVESLAIEAKAVGAA